MAFTKQEDYRLSNFEGPLDFLLSLIQRDEIEILDIPIQELIQQFMLQRDGSKNKLESGSEFIAIAAHFVWLKSKALLPSSECIEEEKTAEDDPHFEIIHHLIDYCRFKQAAKELAKLQEKQQACYVRGVEIAEWKKPLGIDHISLDELSLLFKEMILKGETQNKTKIQEENWRVSDKIKWLRHMLGEILSFPLMNCFHSQQSRGEMIVLFLAILELMKMGEIIVKRDLISKIIVIEKYKESG